MSIPFTITVAPEDVEAHMARYRPGYEATKRQGDLSGTEDVEAHMPRVRFVAEDVDVPGKRPGSDANSPGAKRPDDDVEAHGTKRP